MMNKGLALWRMVRPVNLLIIALTMAAVWFALSSLSNTHLDLKYPLLALTPLLLAVASGNVINDVIDHECDSANGKSRNPVGRLITKEAGHRIAMMLGLASIIFALFLNLDRRILILILVTLVLLWLYSYILQKVFFLGNLLIALLCTVPVAICSLSYGFNPFSNPSSSPLLPEQFKLITIVPLFYMIFAFILTLVREVVKDIEDMKGDSAYGYQTIPVKIGFKRSRNVVAGLVLFAIALELGLLIWLLSANSLISSAWPIVIGQMLLPLLIVFFNVIKMNSTKMVKRVSNMLKITMLLGLSTCLFFTFL